jgi:6-phosphogluconolactonase
MHADATIACLNTPAVRWHVVENSLWLASALDWIDRTAAAALAERGQFHLVLAGGDTPRRIYQALSGQTMDWANWHIWFGDERCLPRDDPHRNSWMATDAWLGHVGIPARNLHIIPAELNAAAAAESYARELNDCETFDLVLLGLGQDGHTASLFPGRPWGTESDAPDTLAVFDAPKPPLQRVSLSARRLSRAGCVLFLVSGADKRAALSRWRLNETLPAAAIQPIAGVDLLVDTDACPPGEPE